jgi:hypothetical protein
VVFIGMGTGGNDSLPTGVPIGLGVSVIFGVTLGIGASVGGVGNGGNRLVVLAAVVGFGGSVAGDELGGVCAVAALIHVIAATVNQDRIVGMTITPRTEPETSRQLRDPSMSYTSSNLHSRLER